MKIVSYLAALLLLSICLPPAHAQKTSERTDLANYQSPYTRADLNELTQKADAVVVADVKSLSDSPAEVFRFGVSSRAKNYSAILDVREVLKGNISMGRLEVAGILPITPSKRSRGGPLASGMTRIFLLSKQSSGWGFSDPFYSVFIAPPVIARPRKGSVRDNVLSYMLAALSSDLVSVDEKRDLVQQLRGTDDPQVTKALQAELQQTKDEILTCSILSSLILRKDEGAIATAREMIPTTNYQYAGMLVTALASLQRKDLLPEIGAALQSSNESVCMAAAVTLGDLQYPEAESYLLNALDSSNRRLVTQIMVMLADKHKEPDWSPSFEDDKRWDDLLLHWKDYREKARSQTGQ